MTKTRNGKTEFRFHRPGARQVFLAGDFNDWDKATLPMRREPNGYWCCRLQLPEGVYQFRYYADGEWYTDYAAFGIAWAPFGCNSVLVMPDSDLRGVPL
jgi:1,4-alpha-glucan branching enzyme